MNWKHYRTALQSALDSIGRFDWLTPAEADAVATHMAASGIKTLRDELAARAMQGFVSCFGVTGGPDPTAEDIARWSVDQADALLAELARDETVEKIEEVG